MFTTNLDEIDDLDVLKLHLTAQRRKLTSLIDLLVKTEFDYENVVPRDQYESLFNEKVQLETNFNDLKRENQRLTGACVDLIRKTKNLIDERDEYYRDWQRNRENLTPRPDWDKVSNVIDAGEQRWPSLARGKTSDELVEVLLEEIEGESTPNNHFVHRRMGRRIVGILIKEIWHEKLKNSSNRPLVEEMREYFLKRFDSKDVAEEIEMDFRHACRRYRHNEQIRLFDGILNEKIEEFVYHHERKSIGKLCQNFLQTINADPPVFLLSNDEFRQSLKNFLPRKTSSQLDELFQSARRDSMPSDDRICLRSIFVEDDQNQFGFFLSKFVEQMRDEKNLYVEQMKEILIGFPLINVVQFTRAVRMIDPLIDETELSRYVNWIFDPKENFKALDLEILLKRLENLACFQH